MPEMGTTDGIKDDIHTIGRQALNLCHKILLLVINRDRAQLGNSRCSSRGTSPEHLQPGQTPKLQECRADPARGAVNQRTLARFDVGGAMHHLVRRDVVQYEADGFGGVQAGGHRDHFTLRQADELCVRTFDGHSGDNLSWFESRDAGAELVHHADQVPSGREGHWGCFGVHALPRHNVRQGDTRSEHLNPHLTTLRLRALFLNHLQCVEPAIVSDDDARVFQGKS